MFKDVNMKMLLVGSSSDPKFGLKVEKLDPIKKKLKCQKTKVHLTLEIILPILFLFYELKISLHTKKVRHVLLFLLHFFCMKCVFELG